jgi:hypothetical protein
VRLLYVSRHKVVVVVVVVVVVSEVSICGCETDPGDTSLANSTRGWFIYVFMLMA